MSLVITDIPEQFVRILNYGRTFIRSYRRYLVTHIRNPVRILNYNFLRFLISQIREFLKHLLRRMKVEWCLIVCILEAFTRHKDSSVYLILRIQEVNVTGGYHRLIEYFAKFHYSPVHILNILNGIDILMLIRQDHEHVVAHRLNLKIIIEVYKSCYLSLVCTVQQFIIEFTRLTGRTQDESLAILNKETLGHTGLTSSHIEEMRHRYKLVQIHPAHIILGKNNSVV